MTNNTGRHELKVAYEVSTMIRQVCANLQFVGITKYKAN